MSQESSEGQSALLVESEERYRTLIENASDLIQSVRPDGSFEFVNKTWLDRLGYTEDELPSLNVWDIIHPDSVDACQVHFGQAIGGTPLDHFDAIFKTKDGRAIPVEGGARPRFLDGKVIATHSFFRDVSERLRAEELQSRNDQLEREQQARYLEKMAALGKLSAGLSHELNNPAAAAARSVQQLEVSLEKRDTAVRELALLQLSGEQWNLLSDLVDRCLHPRPGPGELSLMEMSRQEDEVQDWLSDVRLEQPWNFAPLLVQAGICVEDLQTLAASLSSEAVLPAVRWLGESLAIQSDAQVVARSTQRISDLVGAVKSYSFRDQATEQVVDIHDGLEDTITILAYHLREMSIERDYDRTAPKVPTSGSSLNQLWTNLLDNAIDATDGKGTIKIRTSGRCDRVVIEIIDNGPGIPEDVLTRIFEPFFTTKPQGQGTGLGLDIAWRTVTEEHGGTIEVESEPGQTLFRITLPVAS